MGNITIIGTGLAGYTLAKEIRKLDKDAELRLISSDSGGFYSKPMLSNVLAKAKTPETLITATAEEMAQQLSAEILSNTTVTRIDAGARSIDLQLNEGSRMLTYDRLVLAVGAEPVDPRLEGDAGDSVLSVNSIADYEAFFTRVAAANKVTIIGSGLVGCEFANDLLSVGKEVSVIGPSALPLDGLIPEEVARVVKKVLAEQGVHWHLGVYAKSVNHDANKYAVKLSDGSHLQADVVLSAVGVRPKLELAKAMGLHTNKGIVVNEYCETSIENVYALGDCMEINNAVLAYVLPIMNCARALAKTLSGDKTRVHLPAMPVVVKTPAIPVVAAPPASTEGQWQYDYQESGLSAQFLDKNGSLLGFALAGDAVKQRQSLSKLLPDLL